MGNDRRRSDTFKKIATGSTAGALAGAVGATASGHLGAGAAAAAAGALTPLIEAALEALAIRVSSRQRDRMASVLAISADQAALSMDELLDQLEASPKREELFLRALRAAGDTALEEKLRALGRALASGALLDDDAQVDLEILFVRAMEDVDAPHLKLLAEMASQPPERGAQGFEVQRSLNRLQLEKLVPALASAIGPLVSVLAARGLIEDVTEKGLGSSFGGGASTPSWEVTELGHLVVERIRNLGGK